MIVESPQNWESDRQVRFSGLGVSERFQRAASSMRMGDILITYVAKGGGFADVRSVESDTLERASDASRYDREFEFRLPTRPVVTLNRHQWIPVKGLLDGLEMTRGKKNWSWVFRTSVKALSEVDGKRLVSEIRRAAKGET